MEKTDLRKAGLLLACIALPLCAGVVGSFFTSPAIPGWYAGLIKPSFSPPDWLFAPVWTILYILMGVALFLVIRDGLDTRNKQNAAGLFAVQLSLNVLWSVLFFGLQSPKGAFVDIVALLVTIAATFLYFQKVSRTAALLLLPYLCWAAFAADLNLAIVLLN